MLKAENIHKRFGDLEVLKGVDISVQKAEIISIVGSSGAGKTTLLQILGTLAQADQGDVFYDGINVSSMKNRALADFRNQNIGFVFQFHHLLAEFTALENICIPALIGGTSKAEAEQKAKSLLERLNLSDRWNHKPSELSGGEQQRVATARALMNNPKIVFADEPSGNLDSKNADELHQLFFDLRKEMDQTFVIVTHNRELSQRCDRVYEMKDGKIIS